MESKKNKLALITVVYNNYLIMQEFIKSVERQKKNFHLFISDLSDMKEEIKIDNTKYSVLFSKNKGYAHGVNLALLKAKEAGFENFCIVNNDTFFESSFTENVLNSIKKNPLSLIGGKIYYAAGYEYHKKRYSIKDRGKVIWYAGGYVDWAHAITKHKGVDTVDKGKFNKLSKTGFITGALIFFDLKTLDSIDLWNENYFLYFEDAEWCEKAKRKKISLYFDPGVVIWHKVAQSTGGSGSDIHREFQERNRLIFGLKYAPFRTKIHLLKNYLSHFFQKKI
jgi:GT2 family glycosyltransferase